MDSNCGSLDYNNAPLFQLCDSHTAQSSLFCLFDFFLIFFRGKTFALILERTPLLRGLISAFHPVAVGSNPEHTIYAFSICIVNIAMRKGRKLIKEAGIGPF